MFIHWLSVEDPARVERGLSNTSSMISSLSPESPAQIVPDGCTARCERRPGYHATSSLRSRSNTIDIEPASISQSLSPSTKHLTSILTSDSQSILRFAMSQIWLPPRNWSPAAIAVPEGENATEDRGRCILSFRSNLPVKASQMRT
jgi:hypothetical protein